jgi:Asp-tRNA(Asn)/Glu-tRNA(Gln) amidotransferase A subunit family amidase
VTDKQDIKTVRNQPIGGKDADYDEEDETGRYKGLDMTYPFNFFSQCPVITVPSGFTTDGLPTGLQMVGRRYDESTLMKIAATLESINPWIDSKSSSVDPVATYRILVAHFVVITGLGLAGTTR